MSGQVLVSGALAASLFHVVVPLTGGESLYPPLPCFSGHWHAARQYVTSRCELLRPAGWQRKATHTHTLAAAFWSQLNAAPASRLLPPDGPTTPPPVR